MSERGKDVTLDVVIVGTGMLVFILALGAVFGPDPDTRRRCGLALFGGLVVLFMVVRS